MRNVTFLTVACCVTSYSVAYCHCFWWQSSLRDAGAWTKPVISSEFSLQGDYHMCQHAFHSHIIKCFGPFTANYTIANAFFCAHPLPPGWRWYLTFWQVSIHLSSLVCLHWIGPPGNHCLLCSRSLVSCETEHQHLLQLSMSHMLRLKGRNCYGKCWSERSIDA